MWRSIRNIYLQGYVSRNSFPVSETFAKRGVYSHNEENLLHKVYSVAFKLEKYSKFGENFHNFLN